MSTSDFVNSDLVVGIVVALAASALAVLWPTVSAAYQRKRFGRLLKRELQEIAPHNPEQPTSKELVDDPSIPWWKYLQRTFVHEHLFRAESVVEHRDFVLKLDPDLVYLVSQLWSAYDQRDLRQWCYYLSELEQTDSVRSDELKSAVAAWKSMLSSREKNGGLGRGFSRGRRADETPAEVIRGRLGAYGSLLAHTEWQPNGDRSHRAVKLREWFYDGCNGLLLSGDALTSYREVRRVLADPAASGGEVEEAMSALRTELKIDLGVRDVSERHIPLPT